MTEDQIELLIHEKTEEHLDKRTRTSFWRSVFATALILPLAYFGVSALADRAARNSASQALQEQEHAWAEVYSHISEDAVHSAINAEAAKRSATNASSRAKAAAKKLEAAANNISETLGFSDKDEVVNAVVETADIQTLIANVSQIRVGRCQLIDGQCGIGTYKQPTFYLDRVRFSCPEGHPILSGVRFKRCGAIDTKDEGLLLVATCCALSMGEQ